MNTMTKEVEPVRMTVDVTKPTFRYVESLWFRHHDMVKKLKEIETDAMSQSGADDNAGIRPLGRISKPVEQAVIHNLTDRKKAERLEEQIKAVEYVYNMLPPDHKKVIHARYYTRERRTWAQIAKRSDYSIKQAQRIRNGVIVATAERLGLW